MSHYPRFNEARTALGLSNPAYIDPTLTAGSTTIKAVHIQELRERVKSAWTTSNQVPRDGIASLSYDVTSNRISTAGYEYDAAGNLTRSQASAGGWQRFEYDAAGRLVNVKTDANVLIANYTYGSSNQRLITTEGNLKTYYAWAGDATIAEYTEANSSGIVQWSKSYVYLGARLLATLQPNGNGGEFTQFHHPDRLGTRLITNAQDTSVQEQVSLPYGTALDAESTGSTNRRFTSYDRSASTGLDYAVNRHYDSMQGRFTQVDPIGMGATSLANPQSLNLYAYCGNDPINHTDPDGLFWKKLFKFWAFGIFAFKVAREVALKVLASKWGQLIIGVIIIAFTGPAGGLLFGLAEGATISLSTAQVLLAGAQAAGAVANHLQDRRRRHPDEVRDRYFEKFIIPLTKCIRQIFKEQAQAALDLLQQGTPDLDMTQTARQVGSQGVSGATGRPVRTARAINLPNKGPNGTILVAREYSPPNKPESWVYESYTHELGNILASKVANDEFKYGNRRGIGKGRDRDTGANLEKCVHGKVRY